MPTYGYQCTQCGNGFETVQKITDDPLTTCEACGGQLRKKIFPVGIAFKGSGFYVNDYAKSSGNASSAAPAENSSSEEKSGAPSDTAAGTNTGKDKPAAPAATETAVASSPAPAAPAAANSTSGPQT